MNYKADGGLQENQKRKTQNKKQKKQEIKEVE